ncbi:MAG: EAL domain-containing protein, partial [Moraxellaceae bacterium]|nr:EAL domain-containing protein [Moraxellaceae bacterium]
EYSERRDFVQTLCLQMKQKELSLLQEVAAAANEADSVESVLQFAVDRICVHAGWPVGHALLADPDRADGLLALSVWHMRDLERYAPVKSLGDFARREAVSSIAHTALSSGQSVWSNDLASVDERHARLANAAGIQAGFAFPVKVGLDVVAVLEFFSEEHMTPEAALLDALEHIGTQLARVFERQQRHQERLLHAALHDSLTGLPNRAYLLDHLRRAIALSQRRQSYVFAVLFLDVDRFKWVNDSLGHVAGDLLLIEIARRLHECLRPTDIVARLGGDEFAVLLNDISTIDDALHAARRIHTELKRPVSLGNQDAVVSASIGIALGDRPYEAPEELLRDADTAMYYAKSLGHKGEHAVFADFMQQQAASRLRMTSDLRRAIETGQLELYYQPVVSLSCGRLASFEALLRWRHPEQGLLGPDLFIPLAEETGLIIPLTDWVMRTACEQLANWQAARPEVAIGVSINICARTFSDPAMPAQIESLLSEYGVAPGSLRLEVTESQLMQNAASFSHNLSVLNHLSIPVYIDDFGTGYSSLSYLTSFNVSALKIDRSFVERLGSGEREAVIVRTIVALAHHLGMTVIAEGVESVEQLDFLRGLGCQFGQGYLFSRPLEAGSVLPLLDRPLLLPFQSERVTV